MRAPHRSPGAVDTPEPIARRLAEVALDGRRAPRTVVDSAAGDGRLLAAVVDACEGSPSLLAADVDGETWRAGRFGRDESVRFVHGDALGRTAEDLWGEAVAGGVDLVIGNPPFLSQLAAATARTPAQREKVRDLGGVSTLADTAAAFLVQACEMLGPGGRVAMIMPLSFVSARDGRSARRRILESCRLLGIWVSDGSVFPGAAVETCAVVLERADAHGPREMSVRRWRGPTWDPAPTQVVDRTDLSEASTWSHLVGDLLGGLPDASLAPTSGCLGELVSATAGFRDQFYGLAPLVRSGSGRLRGRTDGLAPVLTSGSIDPGRVLWSDRPARIAGRDVVRPVIDPSDIVDASLAAWVAARRVPKVVVATQTRIVEAAADPTGEWVPLTPVVSVECDAAELWRTLAVLMSPPVTAWARRHYTGAARSAGSIKLSARQVREVPLPGDPDRWQAAADIWEEVDATGGDTAEALDAAGLAMCAAYGAGAEVLDWWRARIRHRR